MRNLLKDGLYLSGSMNIYKRLYYWGLGAFIVMFIFSVLFYKERIIFLDTAHYLFYIVKDHSFSLYTSRCGAFVSQLLPVLAVRCGLPLSDVVLAYSLGFPAFYFICYIICGTLFRQYELALSLLLFHILFVTATFYYIPSELPLGVDFLLIIFAYIKHKQPSGFNSISSLFLCISCFFAAYFHPLVVVILVYALSFLVLHNDSAFTKKTCLRIIICFCAGFVVKVAFFSIPYDRHAASGIKNFITLFPNYFDLYSNRFFFSKCIGSYCLLPVTCILVAAVYFANKEWKKLTFFGGCFIGYILLVNVSYPTAATPDFYFENLYLPLGIFVAMPFVYIALPWLTRFKLAMPVFVLITIVSSCRLYNAHGLYTARLNWERNFLREHAGKKAIYPSRNLPMDTLLMTWGTPYEFWLLSTIEQNKTESIIIDNDPDLRRWAKGTTNAMVVNWNVITYDKLDTIYFHLTDTVTGYDIIK